MNKDYFIIYFVHLVLPSMTGFDMFNVRLKICQYAQILTIICSFKVIPH